MSAVLCKAAESRIVQVEPWTPAIVVCRGKIFLTSSTLEARLPPTTEQNPLLALVEKRALSLSLSLCLFSGM